MKPFARMTSQAVALRRLILVSILVLAVVAFIGVLQMKWVAHRGARAETVRRLKAITTPEVCFYAPATMKDFAEHMNQATKDFDDPSLPMEKRGIKFVCKESVAAKVGPKPPKQDEPLIVNDSFRATTAWDALTNVCNSVGCKFEVRPGKVELCE